MNSANLNTWYVAGLILVALLALYAPRFAGAFVVLIVLVLAFTAARKGLV